MRDFVVAMVSVAFVLAAASQSAAQFPGEALCVTTTPGNLTVNLSSIEIATYNGQLMSSSAGLLPVQVAMSWCKALSEPYCSDNQTGLSMVITNPDGSCVADFSAVSGPAIAQSNTWISFVQWSADSGALATINVYCDEGAQPGAATLLGPISNDPFFEYVLNFNSSAACGTSAPHSAKRRIFSKLHH